RSLLKQPNMTFPYGVEEQGMNLQVWKECNDVFPDEKAPKGFFGFIAGKIEEAIKKELPGAHVCREYLRNLSARVLDQGRFLQTISSTSFPVISSYLEQEQISVYAHDGGRMRIKGRETSVVAATRQSGPQRRILFTAWTRAI